DTLSKSFPSGVHYQVAFDSATFVQESISDALKTLILAIILVILVIYLFLQNGRSTLIPAITIPIALIGTFAMMKLLGFTINSITLFGITLATGLVVDDAIVVIENIERTIRERKLGSMEGAQIAMNEIQGAVVASSLVLLAVFVPVAFFPGTTGELYKQFAITIASSVAISLFVSLTLAPALAAILVNYEEREPRFGLFKWFNRRLEAFRTWYREHLPAFMNHRRATTMVFVAALVVAGILFKVLPTGFIPDEDQGFMIVLLQAPQGTSLAGEHTIALQAEKIVRGNPEVADLFDVGGFSFSGSAPNNGIMFIQLKPWNQRGGATHSASTLVIRFFMEFAKFPQAQVFAFNPPAINGVGSIGGFQFELEDRGNVGLPKLAATSGAIMGAAAGDKSLANVFTQFRINSPEVDVHVDRNKATSLGISLDDIFTTLGASLSPTYVDDFDYLNRSYHVYVQAEQRYRDRYDSLSQLYVRSSSGGLSPLGSLVTVNHELAPPSITHYDLYRSIELSGSAGSGHSSGQAISAMEGIANRVDPAGVSYEWSGITLDEIEAGSLAVIIFALGIVFVFLVLSALYESWIDPLIVMLAVPAALLGALLFILFRTIVATVMTMFNIFILHNVAPIAGPSQDVYAQVGYVMLIGLASKNAILIVQFANQQIEAGADVRTAALRAAQTRLRPILMTSIAFIIGALPLMFATGAGSAARQSLGTVVVGGMIVSTLLNLGITPVLYYMIKSWEVRRKRANVST
ncbi:MAG TPA: efflux RND transporter permease subunit, partial [Candidatus Baltobacteraceae bacterium]